MLLCERVLLAVAVACGGVLLAVAVATSNPLVGALAGVLFTAAMTEVFSC